MVQTATRWYRQQCDGTETTGWYKQQHDGADNNMMVQTTTHLKGD